MSRTSDPPDGRPCMGSPTIQARYYEERYPVGRFILRRASELGLSRTALVRRFRYTDLTNGHRALSELMTMGVMPPQIGRHFADALEIDDTLADAILAATASQREDEEGVRTLAVEDAHRSAFEPHLRVETAGGRPSPIFIIAMIGASRILNVELPPEVWEASGDDRDRRVKGVILDHYREKQGRVTAFGEITGYVLVTLPGYGIDFGLPYSIDGEPTGPMRPVQRIGEATLGTKRGDNRLGELFRKSLGAGDPGRPGR